MENNNNFQRYGFDELKYYIMTSIKELKQQLDEIQRDLYEWRNTSLIDLVEIKTKVNVGASMIALAVSLIVSTVITLVFK